MPSLDEGTPLFVQIAEQLADDIVDGALAEGARVPSTNELAAFYRINPATAAKGINVLVDEAVLEKRRGIGMFVASGAREQLRERRRKQFAEQYLDPMLAEARRLGIDTDTLVSLIRGSGWHNGGTQNDPADLYDGAGPPLPRPGRARQCLAHGRSRHRDRAAGPQRRGQDHAHAHHHRPGVSHQRRCPGVRSRLRRRMTRCCAAWCSCARNRPIRIFRVGQAVRVASWFYPNWSEDLARQLLADFGLPLRRRIRKLSRGMRSAVGITIGLAARAELTLFDEPYAGLDAVARQLFYDRLLADFAEHPRTVVLSTHLIDEAADMLEHVVMLDRGRVVLDAPADDVRGTTVTVSGPATAVDEFVAGRAVWHRQQLGSRASVTVAGPFDLAAQARARALHLSLEPLSLQQLLVHAASVAAEEKVSA